MINIERIERVVHLRIDVPPVNVLDTAALHELSGHLKTLAADTTVGAVLLSGNGKCFSAGASVEEHREESAPAMIGAFVEALEVMGGMPQVTAALVHGSCLGGALELAHGCDFIIADPGALFGVPEITLAFFPPFACADLPAAIGRQNAAWAVFSGETFPAERALAMGLVQKLQPREEWGKMTDHFNRLSLPVLRLAKQAFRKGAGAARTAPLTEFTRIFLEDLYKFEDVKEGVAAFREKRKPAWKHR